MRKTIVILLAVFLFGSAAVQADTPLRPINVQNAVMGNDENENAELRINFDWFRDHVGAGGVSTRTSVFNMPRVDIRQACTDCPIPFRIGVNTALNVGSSENDAGGTEFNEHSAFGMGNLGITLEAQLFQSDDARNAANLYINQTIPWIHNDLLVAGTLRPQNGVNAYGFQTGLLYQFGLGDHLTWYGDVGYRFDVPSAGAVQHSIVYYNEAVLGLGDEQNFGLTLGLLGNSVYTDGIGTDLRVVPGIAAKIGDDSQLRFGFPIGLTRDSNDIGVQVGYFTAF